MTSVTSLLLQLPHMLVRNARVCFGVRRFVVFRCGKIYVHPIERVKVYRCLWVRYLHGLLPGSISKAHTKFLHMVADDLLRSVGVLQVDLLHLVGFTSLKRHGGSCSSLFRVWRTSRSWGIVEDGTTAPHFCASLCLG